MATKTTAFALAALSAIALPGAAAASSFSTLGAAPAGSPSIITLGEPAPETAEAKTTASDAAPDPMRTAAVAIASPSIIALGTPAPDEPAADPTERDEQTAVKPAESAVRTEAMPVVMRGDFGALRGSDGESIAVQAADSPAGPAAPADNSAAQPVPASAPPPPAGSGGMASPAGAQPPQEPELSPAERDR